MIDERIERTKNTKNLFRLLNRKDCETLKDLTIVPPDQFLYKSVLGCLHCQCEHLPFLNSVHIYPTLLSASAEAQTEHDEVATRAGGVGVFSSRRLISSEGENTHTRCEVALTCLKGSPCFDIQHNYLTRRSFWQEIWKLKISNLKFLSQMWCVCELMLSLQRLRWCIWARK